MVLSLDDNRAELQFRDEGNSNRVDVESEISAYESEGLGGGAVARKRVRFE